ncbi:MAG: glycoside hydrolase family 26 protein [Ktedonobacteraceae bacterium]
MTNFATHRRYRTPFINLGVWLVAVIVGSMLVSCSSFLSQSPQATPQPKPQIYYGVNVKGLNPPDLPGLISFEAQANKNVAIVMWFQAWGSTAGKQSFDPALMTAVRNHGSIPMLTWEPWNPGQGPKQPQYSLSNIIQGHFDSYITQFAQAAKAWGHPFFLRFAHEMNANWYPWGVTNGNKLKDYVLAWRHVHDIFTSVGATNATWVWAVSMGSDLQTYQRLYPGDNYVDWVGMDGYNYGGKTWNSFSSVFGSSYQLLLKITNKPFMIAETATSPKGGDKASWISNAFSTAIPDQFTQVKAVVWFDENKEQNWTINSSTSSEQAFATAIHSPIYASNQYANLNTSPIPVPQDVP